MGGFSELEYERNEGESMEPGPNVQLAASSGNAASSKSEYDRSESRSVLLFILKTFGTISEVEVMLCRADEIRNRCRSKSGSSRHERCA